jgi:hypothetical protein
MAHVPAVASHPPEVDLGECRVCVDVVAHVQDVVTLNTQRSLNLAAAAAAGAATAAAVVKQPHHHEKASSNT